MLDSQCHDQNRCFGHTFGRDQHFHNLATPILMVSLAPGMCIYIYISRRVSVVSVQASPLKRGRRHHGACPIYIYIHIYIYTHTTCIYIYMYVYVYIHYITLHYTTLHYITLHYITYIYIHTYLIYTYLIYIYIL